MKRTLSALALAFMLCFTANASVNIIPAPGKIVEGKGEFVLKGNAVIGYNDASISEAATYLKEILAPATGFDLRTRQGSGTINLELSFPADPQDESYTLKVTRKKVFIKARSYKGIAYGIASLRQLLPKEIESKRFLPGRSWTVPVVEVEDAPAYEWRGLMLDPVRHFYSVEETKNLLDLMALYKFSKFHWHLIDSNGWRIEIKAFPLLTSIGAWRDPKNEYIDNACNDSFEKTGNAAMQVPAKFMKVDENGKLVYGGFYTQEEIRDIVHYAAVRGIDVVPEMDFPGHSYAEIRCYPWLSCHGDGHEPLCLGNDKVIDFCKKVFDEVFDLFPYEYVEIGGDEVSRDRWTGCELCQERIAKEGLKDVAELQAWFTREMEKYFNAAGRKLVGWDEILDGGVSPTATVNWWRSDPVTFKKAAVNGNQVIMCPTSHCYFDYAQDAMTIQRLYCDDLIPATLTAEERKLIKGMQGNIWGEFIPTESRMQTMAFPRAIALAEKAWTPVDRHDYDDFLLRLTEQVKRLDVMEVDYRPLDSSFTPGFNAGIR